MRRHCTSAILRRKGYHGGDYGSVSTSIPLALGDVFLLTDVVDQYRAIESGAKTQYRLSAIEGLLPPQSVGPMFHFYEMHDEGFYMSVRLAQQSQHSTLWHTTDTFLKICRKAPSDFIVPEDLMSTQRPETWSQYPFVCRSNSAIPSMKKPAS